MAFASRFPVLASVLGVTCALLAGASLAAPPEPAITEASLEKAVTERLTRVPEFQGLRELCARLKVRCWLFGGTAAGYGHYVKWDLLREAKDPRYQPERFDYDYTNIFRSTQDADIVIDGTSEQALLIEQQLKERFPHFQGSKEAWEVRLLREAHGDKEALLANPDFLNQHTDSNSTGLIEVTKPPPGESAVRDLRDWEPQADKRPRFFQDIHQGKLHYYFSESHAKTSRARAGKNPPILSVIRYLTKAFQYELEVRPQDWATIQRLIREFDPARDLADPYVKKWIEKNGKKLFQHAVNIEYAWDQLEALGLRSKLIGLGRIDAQDTLAWWLNREPLRSRPVGTSGGRTAMEIFGERGLPLVVAHETKDFLAYESITRAHTGEPNVLSSRAGASGELAAHGDGFYTRMGREGATGSGLTIRFNVDPNAREGADFVLGSRGDSDYVIFRNKSALRVIPESLKLGPVEFFRMLLDGETLNPSDKGMFEKLKRRISHQSHLLTPQQVDEIADLLLANPEAKGIERAVSEYFALPALARRGRTLEVGEKLMALGDPEIARAVIRGLGSIGIPSDPQGRERTFAILRTALDRPGFHGGWLAEHVLSRKEWIETAEGKALLETLLERGHAKDVVPYVLKQPFVATMPEAWRWLTRALEGTDWTPGFHAARSLFTQPEWASKPGAVDLVLRWLAPDGIPDRDGRTMVQRALLEDALRNPVFAKHPRAPALWKAAQESGRQEPRRLLEGMLKEPAWASVEGVFDFALGEIHKNQTYSTVTIPIRNWGDHPRAPELARKVLGAENQFLLTTFLGDVLGEPDWLTRPEAGAWLREGWGKVSHPSPIKFATLLHWKPSAEAAAVVRRALDEKELGAETGKLLTEFLTTQKQWASLPEAHGLLRALIDEGHGEAALLGPLAQNTWKAQPDVIELATRAFQKTDNQWAITSMLTRQGCGQDPACLKLWELALKRPALPAETERIFQAFLDNNPQWLENPELRRICGGQAPTPRLLHESFLRGERIGGIRCVEGALGRLAQ